MRVTKGAREAARFILAVACIILLIGFGLWVVGNAPWVGLILIVAYLIYVVYVAFFAKVKEG